MLFHPSVPQSLHSCYTMSPTSHVIFIIPLYEFGDLICVFNHEEVKVHLESILNVLNALMVNIVKGDGVCCLAIRGLMLFLAKHAKEFAKHAKLVILKRLLFHLSVPHSLSPFVSQILSVPHQSTRKLLKAYPGYTRSHAVSRKARQGIRKARKAGYAEAPALPSLRPFVSSSVPSIP